MIRMKRRVEIRVTIDSDNLNKNLDILMKLGTHVPWHHKKKVL